MREQHGGHKSWQTVQPGRVNDNMQDGAFGKGWSCAINPNTVNQKCKEVPGFSLNHQVIFPEATMHLCQYLWGTEVLWLSSQKNKCRWSHFFQHFPAFLIPSSEHFVVQLKMCLHNLAKRVVILLLGREALLSLIAPKIISLNTFSSMLLDPNYMYSKTGKGHLYLDHFLFFQIGN